MMLEKIKTRLLISSHKILYKPDVYDVLSLVELERRPRSNLTWFRIEPSKVYPPTIERILQVLETGEIPEELIQDFGASRMGVAQSYVQMAKTISKADWSARTKPALEMTRLWFTQALHCAMHGIPIGVHILADEDYKHG